MIKVIKVVGFIVIGLWIFTTYQDMDEKQKAQQSDYDMRKRIQEAKMKAHPKDFRENLVFKTKTPVVDSNYKPNLKLEAAIYSAVQQLKD